MNLLLLCSFCFTMEMPHYLWILFKYILYRSNTRYLSYHKSVYLVGALIFIMGHLQHVK